MARQVPAGVPFSSAAGPGQSPGSRRMSSDESMTHLIHILKVGDRLAAQGLWEAYFRRLVRLARARLARTSTPVADAEDVALGAFDSFYRRAERGECPHLEDRNDLWRLLFVLTVRKAINLVRLLPPGPPVLGAAAPRSLAAMARPHLGRPGSCRWPPGPRA